MSLPNFIPWSEPVAAAQPLLRFNFNADGSSECAPDGEYVRYADVAVAAAAQPPSTFDEWWATIDQECLDEATFEMLKTWCKGAWRVAAAAQPEQDERAAFELWVNSISENPNFNSAAAMWAWSAWQARAALKGGKQ